MINIILFIFFQFCSPLPNPDYISLLGNPICYENIKSPKSITDMNRIFVSKEDLLTGAKNHPTLPSIKGTLDYFTNSQHLKIAEQERKKALSIPIEERIIKHLGIDIVPFGNLLSVESTEIYTKTTEYILTFETGAVYQYWHRIPENKLYNKPVLLIHGCGTDGETTVLGQELDYMNKIGQKLIDSGREIIVPYVNAYCYFDNQIDKLGMASGTTFIAYELQGINEVIKHTGITNFDLYGISMGGILAQFLSSLYDDKFNTVTIAGHDIIDYLLASQIYFSEPNKNKHYAPANIWNRYITSDELVLDYLNDNRYGHVRLEISTYDSLNGKDINTSQKLFDNPRVEISWFYGLHEVEYWTLIDFLNKHTEFNKSVINMVLIFKRKK